MQAVMGHYELENKMTTCDEFLRGKVPSVFVLQGCALKRLKELPSESVNCCVTSPPYFGLRDYGVKGQLGLEKTPELYVARLVEIFEEVRRVLRKDGTLWLNLGDSYSGSGCGGNPATSIHQKQKTNRGTLTRSKRLDCPSLKPKDLIGIPWLVAFALRSAGWWLRSDIIWAKANCMPESVTDRPTRSHEYIFLLTKSARYWYDAKAIKERPSADLIQQIQDGYSGSAIKDYLGSSVQDASATKSRIINGYRSRIEKQRGHSRRHAGFNDKWDALTPAEQAVCGSNKRDVWTVAPANYPDAHFATFPQDLIKPCVLAGCPVGGVVLDPFAGSGTTGEVALELGRKALLIELNPDYIRLIEKRTNVTPGLALDTPR